MYHNRISQDIFYMSAIILIRSKMIQANAKQKKNEKKEKLANVCIVTFAKTHIILIVYFLSRSYIVEVFFLCCLETHE